MSKITVPPVGSPTWVTNDADTPPSVPNAMDDEFEGSVLDAKWSWVNQGTTTVSLALSHLKANCPVDAGAIDNHLLVQNTPVGNWVVGAKMQFSGLAANYQTGGICVRNSSTGRFMAFYIYYNSAFSGMSVAVTRWTNPTTLSAHILNVGYAEYMAYLKIEYDGTNLIFRISRDGVTYATAATEPVATFLSAFHQVGFVVQSFSTAFPQVFDVDWFRRFS